MFSNAHKVTALSITAVLLLTACPQGTQQPSSEPTVAVQQTATPTAQPTATPTEQPTASPTAQATATPTQAATATATATATQAATQVPTQAPTQKPTTAPTQAPPTTAPPTEPPTPSPVPTATPIPTSTPVTTLAPQGTPSTYIVKGTVTDASTGAPLSNVCIVVGIPGNFCWASTDANGNYNIDLGSFLGGPPPSGQPWELYFVKTGYKVENAAAFSFSGPATVTKNFAMHQ